MKESQVITRYRGFEVTIDSRDIMVRSPFDDDLAFYSTMAGVRCWVRKKLRTRRERT